MKIEYFEKLARRREGVKQRWLKFATKQRPAFSFLESVVQPSPLLLKSRKQKTTRRVVYFSFTGIVSPARGRPFGPLSSLPLR